MPSFDARAETSRPRACGPGKSTAETSFPRAYGPGRSTAAPERLRRRSGRLIGLDVVLGVLLTAVYSAFAHYDGSDGTASFAGPAWVGWVIAGAVGLPIAVRRVFPLTVLAVVTAGLTAATLLDITREPYAAAALALYPVGLCTPVRRAVAALAGALAVATAGLLLAGDVGPLAFVWLVLAGGWAAGYAMRRLRLRADRDAAAAVERIRADERLLIVREVHDIMSHHMSLIAVQAGVANHVAEEHPEEVLEALRVIEGVSRGALDEMRSMIGVLRHSPSTVVPAPGLDRLRDLVVRASAGGVTVDLDVAMTATPPAGVQAAAYRIVQEALTNAVKHAAPAHCTVRVEAGPYTVDIDVTDDGPPAVVSAGGHGLVGMRERAALYGGEFRAGPRPGGGFAVTVRLPYVRTREAA